MGQTFFETVALVVGTARLRQGDLTLKVIQGGSLDSGTLMGVGIGRKEAAAVVHMCTW